MPPRFNPANFKHVLGAVKREWHRPDALRRRFEATMKPAQWNIYVDSHLRAIQKTAEQMQQEKRKLPKRLPSGVRHAINSRSINTELRALARTIADFHGGNDYKLNLKGHRLNLKPGTSR